MSAAELRADLSAYMAEDLADIDPATDAPPVIDDIATADRALRRLSETETQMRRVEALAADEIRRVERWKAERLEILERDHRFWAGTLEAWHRAIVERGGARTQRLPNGTLRLRQTPPKVVPATKEPGEDAPVEFVRVRREWAKSEVPKRTKPGREVEVDPADAPPEGWTVHEAVTADGEIVPNITYWVPSEPSFSVQTEVV